jgi:hypothetical protein
LFRPPFHMVQAFRAVLIDIKSNKLIMVNVQHYS